MASAVARDDPSSTSLHTIRPPRRASSVANAAPMPLPAPVMTAAAPWLRLGEEPKTFTTVSSSRKRSSPGHPADRLAAQRLFDERRHLPHRGCGLGGQLRQRLEDVYLIGPD